MQSLKTHTNSFLSHQNINKYQRRQIILNVYRSSNRPLTDREVAERAGFCEMNAVRPRITEMIEDGILQECGVVKSQRTGRRVRTVFPAGKTYQTDLFDRVGV
jgi:DNA-binding Lrp family transcriptional regulator